MIVAAGTSGEIQLGTSGFDFRDWFGRFYPSGLAKRHMLEYYSRFFSCVEINATYYRLPSPTMAASWVRRTPETFRFIVKAHRSATHERARMAEDMPAFLAGIEPLVAADRLDGVLLQFPESFRRSEGSREHLARTRRALDGLPVFCEFRHASWCHDDVFAFLGDRDIGYCAVDEPELPGLMPSVMRVTSDEAYVRFHGRNAGAWRAGTRAPGADRYDWRYSKEELACWVEKIRAVANRTRRTWVFFNNCHEAKAIDGAHLLAEMLTEEIPT